MATFLTDARFVDDLNDCLNDIESALRLKFAVDEDFLSWEQKSKVGPSLEKNQPKKYQRTDLGV